MQKVVLAIKKWILTSERHAEHPFAGRNTQHPFESQANWTSKYFLALTILNNLLFQNSFRKMI